MFNVGITNSEKNISCNKKNNNYKKYNDYRASFNKNPVDKFEKSTDGKNKSNTTLKIAGLTVLASIAAIALFKITKGKIKNPIKPPMRGTIRDPLTTFEIALPEEIARIQKGIMGRIRNASQLTTADIKKVIDFQLKNTSPKEVQEFINSLPKAEQAMASRLLNKMTQFGNMNSIDEIAGKIPSFSSDAVVFYDDMPSLSNTMQYLTESKNAIKKGGLNFSKNRGVCLLDEITLKRLETDDGFLKLIKNNDKIKLATPEGWIQGFNPFNQTKDLNSTASKLLDEVKTIMRNNPGLTEEKAITEALNRPVLKRLEKLGIGKNVEIIKNPRSINHGTFTPSSEQIAEQLNHSGMNEKQLNEIINQFHDDYHPYIKELLAQGINVNSPKALSLKMQKMHQQILNANGGKSEGIYYLVPQSGKSYSTVTMQYQIANDIPTSKILSYSDLSKIPSDAKKIVILDDVAGSGSSLNGAYGVLSNSLSNTSHNINDIIIAPVITSTDAMKLFSQESSSKGISLKYLSGEIVPSIKETAYYKSLSELDKTMLKKVIAYDGYGENCYNVSFPYMAPDNNNAFFSTFIAEYFTLNGGGVKGKSNFLFDYIRKKTSTAA